MARPIEPATDCQFFNKAAVRDAGAAPSRGVTPAAGGPGANADCRFPGDAARAGTLPLSTELVTQAAPKHTAATQDDLQAAQKHTEVCTAGNSTRENRAQVHTPGPGSAPIDAAPGSGPGARTTVVRATHGPEGAWAVRADPLTHDAPCASTSRTAAAPARSPATAPPPPVDPPFSAAAPGVPTAVSHGATPEKVDAGAQVRAIAKPKIWSWLRKEVDAPWGRSLDEDGTWVEHHRCRCCGCIQKRPHFTRGYCKPCYYRSPFGRTRNFEHYVERRRRLRANDRDGQWLRVMVAAARKRHIDRDAGLVPDYSVIAYCVTCKLFNGRCARCNSPDDLTIDHHYPAAADSPIEPGNAVLLCRACNGSKGARLPAEFYSPEQLARIERTLQLAAELTPLMEKLLPRLDLRRIRGRLA